MNKRSHRDESKPARARSNLRRRLWISFTSGMNHSAASYGQKHLTRSPRRSTERDLIRQKVYYRTLVSGGFDLENEDPTNIDYIYLELWDSSPTIAVNPGTYTFDLDNTSDGYVSYVEVFTGYTYASATDEETWDYYAAPADYGDADDTIISGTVVVAVSGSTYTFTMDLTLADGDSISGTYTGVADYQQDLSDEE